MSRYYLMIDLGTGNSRAALVSSDGAILGVKLFENKYYRDEAYEDALYFLPAEWREKILRACSELCEEHPDVRVDAVSSAGARQTIVLFDGENNDFLALPNIDNRGRAYMEEVSDKAEIYRRSGKWATEDFIAAKLMGFRKIHPQEYGKITKMTSVSEWITAIFTGQIVIEPSQACETQLYDIGEKQWSDFLCDRYGVSPDLLPELHSAGTPIRPVLPEFKKQFHMADDAVFIIGGADTQVALKQTDIAVGDIAVVSGTTSPVVTLMNEKFFDEKQRVWTDANLGGDTYQIEMNPGVTGLNYQRMKERLVPDLSYEELEAAYAIKTDFRCTASFSSLLFYEQRSLRKGGFFMKSPFDEEVDRLDMMWAALADIACATFEQFRMLSELTENRAPAILGCGGGFRSPALCQMLSDLSGRELRLRPGFEQATIMGLTSLCNEWFGEKLASSGELIVYHPREAQLVHRYYPVWLENRNRANCPLNK